MSKTSAPCDHDHHGLEDVSAGEAVPSRELRDPSGKVLYFNIVGPSMRPILKPGDLLAVIPYGQGEIRPGDVVVFVPPHEKRLIAHRLLSRDARGWRAQGDNNTVKDPWPLGPGDILGRVAEVRHGRGSKRLASGRSGRVLGLAMRAMNAAWRPLFSAFRPLYRWAGRTGLFRGLGPSPGSLRVMSIARPGGPELRLLWRSRVIGRLPAGQARWLIRPPLRLLIDESRLPKPN